MREATAADIVRSPSETPHTSTTPPGSPAMIPPFPAMVDISSPSGLTIEHDPRWSFMDQVLVGPKQVSFLVHHSVLKTIPFFKLCLNAGMQESKTGQVKLPEDEPAVFAQVVHFAYYGKVEYEVHRMWEQFQVQLQTKEICIDKSMQSLKVYFLAQKLGLEELQNWCIDRIRWSLGHRPDGSAYVEEIQMILDNSLPEHPLLDMIMDAIAYDITNMTMGWRAWTLSRPELYRYFAKDLKKLEMLTEALAVRSTFPKEDVPWACPPQAVYYWHVHGTALAAKNCPQSRSEDELMTW